MDAAGKLEFGVAAAPLGAESFAMKTRGPQTQSS